MEEDSDIVRLALIYYIRSSDGKKTIRILDQLHSSAIPTAKQKTGTVPATEKKN